MYMHLYALDDNDCTTCVGDHVCRSYMCEKSWVIDHDTDFVDAGRM